MIIKYLKQMYSDGRLTRQQYKTFRGQVVANDVIGCIRGLERSGLVTTDEVEYLMQKRKVKRW